jgi:hypothetical protein
MEDCQPAGLDLSPTRDAAAKLVDEGSGRDDAHPRPGRRAHGPPRGGARDVGVGELAAGGGMGLCHQEEVPLRKQPLHCPPLGGMAPGLGPEVALGVPSGPVVVASKWAGHPWRARFQQRRLESLLRGV